MRDFSNEKEVFLTLNITLSPLIIDKAVLDSACIFSIGVSEKNEINTSSFFDFQTCADAPKARRENNSREGIFFMRLDFGPKGNNIVTKQTFHPDRSVQQ
jgi:hypothetical protein